MTRPRAAAERFVAQLPSRTRSRVTVLYSPILEIHPLSAQVDTTGVQGVIFSSANGVNAAVSLQVSQAVVAPYDASVVARHVEPGDWVQPGDKLLTLVSTGPMEARLEVPERFAADLIDATGVVVRSSALDRPLRVLETKRLDDVNPRVRTIQVIAIVENPDAALAAGMSIEGYVPSGQEEEFLTVPKDAIVRRSGQPTVFVVDESSAAKQVSVNVVFETRTRVAVVSSGLNEGASVVVEGNERLIPSQLVRVIDKTLEVTGSIASR